MRKSLFFLLISFMILNNHCAWTAITLPSVISNGMVLQQKSEVTLWGWARPNEEVVVTTGWNKQSVSVRADINARWSVLLKTPQAGGPYDISFKGSNFIVVDDVLIGEVWLCSGQSNMEWSPAQGIDGGEQEILQANDQEIRFFTVANSTADCIQNNCSGNWVKCTPQTMRDFSAVGYFFAKSLREQLKVPVAMIHASWGGTNIETWMNPEWLKEKPLLTQAASKIPVSDLVPTLPGKTYFSMIAPIAPFRLAGMLWYQGESNLFNADAYCELMTSMVGGYRAVWGQELPFLYAQIAPFNYGAGLASAVLRDQQRQALGVIQSSGMVVLSDAGDMNDVHPRNKSLVGNRFAALALNQVYGFKQFADMGPLYRTVRNEGDKIRVHFDSAESGLVADGKELDGFYVASVDRVFKKAKAKIDGNTVVVWADGLKFPVAVRYGFDNAVIGNLKGQSGLPASPFRSDNWPLVL